MLGKGISVENLQLTRSGDDLKLYLYSDTGVQLNYAEIDDGAKDGNYHIDNLRFSDGTTMRLTDLPVEWHGNTGNNTYNALTGQKNSFFGNKGNDYLNGSYNDDSYYFYQGDGRGHCNGTGGE